MNRPIPAGNIVSDKHVYFRKLARHLYQLEKDFFIQTRIRIPEIVSTRNGLLVLTPDGVLCMRQNYVSDGPSGPTVDTKSSMRGGFTHDGGYRLMRRGLISLDTRILWDEEIRDMCIEDKMFKIRAKGWYYSLQKFGEKNALPKNVCPVLCAP